MLTRVTELFDSAGWVAWPLLAMSVVSLALCIERLVFFIGLRRELSSSRVAAAVRAARASRSSAAGPTAPGVLGEFVRSMHGAASGVSVGEAAVLAGAAAVRPRLFRFLPTLSTVITAAPMLGILGTVTGIIESFGLLGSAEAVRDTTAMAAGISEALYTTAFGLTIALVVLFPYNAFRGSADRALEIIETVGAAAIEAEAASQPASPSASNS
ncbi:MAG: MotA/TolQ/ExbB proton channel family protein [Planctomycetota bacterium]